MINAVFRNLFSNAVKFSKHNGEIHISSQLRNSGVIICIADTGTGIDEEMQKDLFNPLVKTSTTGTDGESGTGFGLLLCKELIDKNGGKIWINSKPGVGTKVCFSLLRSPDEANSKE